MDNQISEDKAKYREASTETVSDSIAKSISEKQEELQKLKENESALLRQLCLLLTDHKETAEIPIQEQELSSEISFGNVKESTGLCVEKAFMNEEKPRYNVKLSPPEKYKRGQNFTLFCENFLDYVKFSKVRDGNLYILFLSMVNDFTKDKLKNVTLSREEKRDAKLFVYKYEKRMTLQHEAESLKFKLVDSKQSLEVSVEDYAFRLKQKSARAFTAEEEASRSASCYTAFL